MDDWNGVTERRGKPHEYELRQIIREEIEPLRQQHNEIRGKIDDWEAGAKWFRVFIISTVSLITGGVALYEWIRTHMK